MAKVCEITGARVRRGSRIHRSGLAKKKGGIGRHVTKVVKRDVSPNLRNKRIWVPELNKVPSKKTGDVRNIFFAIEFLIKSNYVNGSSIRIDGGSE